MAGLASLVLMMFVWAMVRGNTLEDSVRHLREENEQLRAINERQRKQIFNMEY